MSNSKEESSKVIDTESFIKAANLLHNCQEIKYDYSKTKYINSRTKLEIFCIKHQKYFWQTSRNHLDNSDCPDCAKEDKKLGISEFIERANKIYGIERFDYSSSIYVNRNIKLKITCNVCSTEFEQSPIHHLRESKNKNGGCPTCQENNSLNTDLFIKRAKEKHDDLYLYDKLIYVNSATKVEIFCIKHQGYFLQLPLNHLSGHGCKKCFFEKHKKLLSRTTEDFVRSAKNYHENEAFNYSMVNYINNKTKVDIICNSCNTLFSQDPLNHLSGNGGCPTCAPNKALNTEEFILRAKNIHGDKYNYDNSLYINIKTDVEIKCNICSKIFYQKPSNHLHGSNCPWCTHHLVDTNSFIERCKEIRELPTTKVVGFLRQWFSLGKIPRQALRDIPSLI